MTWTKTYTKVYKGVSRDTVWKTWSDIDHWPTWHNDLEYCKIQGPFANGSHFVLKPRNSPAVKIQLIDVSPTRKFTDRTTFPLTQMLITHVLEDIDDGLRLTNIVEVNGLLKHLWIRLVINKIAASIPEEMDALVSFVRKNHG